MNLGIENISIKKEDHGTYGVNQGRNETIQIACEAIPGQKVFDIRSIITPASYAALGFKQASPEARNNLNLLAQRKRIKLTSSLNGELIQYDSFIVNSPYSFTLTGGYDIEGADEEEVFVLSIDTFDKVCIQEQEHIVKTYILPSGTSILNLGFSYEIGVNPSEQVGSIKVTRLGKRMYRNVDNAPAAISAEGNYHEIDSGNGLGTAIEFNVAPADDEIISVDFGYYTADANIEVSSSMERLQSVMVAIAYDTAEGLHGDDNISRYLAASPNEIERNTFGNMVIDHEVRLNNLVLGSSSIADALAKFSSNAHFETVYGRPGQESDVYFNTTTHKPMYHDGTIWRDWAGGGAGSTPKEEQFPISATDISNGYLDLSFTIATDSLFLWPVQGTPFTKNYDYTLSEVGGITRITFLSSITNSITTSDVFIAKYTV